MIQHLIYYTNEINNTPYTLLWTPLLLSAQHLLLFAVWEQLQETDVERDRERERDRKQTGYVFRNLHAYSD